MRAVTVLMGGPTVPCSQRKCTGQPCCPSAAYTYPPPLTGPSTPSVLGHCLLAGKPLAQCPVVGVLLHLLFHQQGQGQPTHAEAHQCLRVGRWSEASPTGASAPGCPPGNGVQPPLTGGRAHLKAGLCGRREALLTVSAEDARRGRQDAPGKVGGAAGWLAMLSLMEVCTQGVLAGGPAQ